MKQESDIQTNADLLKQEAAAFYNLAKDYKKERYIREDNESFLMSRTWMKKWKEHVDYPFAKKTAQYSYFYSQYLPNKYSPKPDHKPGPIDNSVVLVDLKEFLNDGDLNNPENQVIRHNIDQRNEIRFVNKAIWEFFQEKYGGGPVVKKGKIEEKTSYSRKKIIEMFYRKFNLLLLPKKVECHQNAIIGLQIRTMYISRTKTFSNFKDKLISLVKDFDIYKSEDGTVQTITDKNFRLWKLNSSFTVDNFKNVFAKNAESIRTSEKEQLICKDLIYLEYEPKISLYDLELADTDLCILEYSNDAKSWIFELKVHEAKRGMCEYCRHTNLLKCPCACRAVWYCSESCLDRDKSFHYKNCKKSFEVEERSMKESSHSKNGLVGLQNLGNTCFMNTSLQCVSNCYEITEYFLKDYYKDHINTVNPIGTSGVLAKAYANLLRNLWYGESHVFSPWNFKKALETFQAMFAGYQQHDTQEFLNYLLDGLHEDLNFVLKKPLVEKDESDSEDPIKSQSMWIGFLRRNQSVMVDLLYGQYKSVLYCQEPQCQNISTTFDPFLSVSLPLVVKMEPYELTCFFIFYDMTISPLQLKLPFQVETTIMALRNKLGKILNIHPFSFVIVRYDDYVAVERMMCSTMLLKTNSRYYQSNMETKPYFMFQIDPEMFYSIENRYCVSDDVSSKYKRAYVGIKAELEMRLEENQKLFADTYEEDETGATAEQVCYYSRQAYSSISGMRETLNKVNTDNNYGFSADYLKVVLLLFKYDPSGSYSYASRKRIIFPRVVFLHKKWTTKQIHMYLFHYLTPLLRSHHKLDSTSTDFPDEKLWEKFFDNYTADNSYDSYEFQKKNAWPYRLRMKNFNANRTGNCPYCNKYNCTDCLFPFDDKISLSDILQNIPNNGDLTVDNTYYYLNEHQKYFASGSKDFILEATWLPEYHNTVYGLNDKTDIDFQIVKSVKACSSSIYDCFKNFIKKEKLEVGNEWFCPQCKKHQQATKKMEIYKSPHILIIHLKRFRNNNKIDTVIDFPINGLDISNFVISNPKNLPLEYDLFAIANHYGSLGFGHYIAFAKNHFDQKWYEFDDSHVSPKNPKDLITSAAYVLFYRRRGLESCINFEEIYKSKFINYEDMVTLDTQNVSQMTLPVITNLSINDCAASNSATIRVSCSSHDLAETIPVQLQSDHINGNDPAIAIMEECKKKETS